MEPLDEKELNQLLRRWEAPDAPASLRRTVLRGRRPWWRWFIAGTIRIPVPVAAVAAMILAGLWVYSKTSIALPVKPPATEGATSPPVMPVAPKTPSSPATAPPAKEPASLAGFQVVTKIEPVLVRRQQ